MEHAIRPGRLEIGKFSLYFERLGRGPALVFLHGLGGNHLSWWQQVPFFMRWYECVTLDQRSFAGSPDPDGLFNGAHHSDLGRLLDRLDIARAVLIGQSMGGWTCVGYALEHPERVAAMVMADTTGGITTAETAEFMRNRPAVRLDSEPAIGRLPTYAADYFIRAPQMAYLYDALRLLGARPPADAAARIGARRFDIAQVREKLTMPVLCLVGEEDVLLPPALIEKVSSALPNATLKTVPHCGHSIYFERAEVFNQLVLEFLRAMGWGAR